MLGSLEHCKGSTHCSPELYLLIVPINPWMSCQQTLYLTICEVNLCQLPRIVHMLQDNTVIMQSLAVLIECKCHEPTSPTPCLKWSMANFIIAQLVRGTHTHASTGGYTGVWSRFVAHTVLTVTHCLDCRHTQHTHGCTQAVADRQSSNF